MTILDRSLKNNRVRTVEGDMAVTSVYTAGIGNETFLRAIKDNEDIVGSYCPKCKKTFLPARLFCERCLSRLSQTKTAPAEGKLLTFTEVHVDLDGKTLKKPRVIGFVGFKGFEGGVIHNIHVKSGGDRKLRSGSKVKPVFRSPNQRTGSILDISHFEVI